MIQRRKSLPKPFYIVKRTTNRRIPKFYYRVLDHDWNVVGEWTTGCSNRTEAYIYATRLLDSGELIPTPGMKNEPANPSRFGDYFADWFDWPKGEDSPRCPYITRKLKRGKSYSRQTASIQRGNFRKYILPTFGNRPKHRISRAEIEEWFYNLPDADPDHPISPVTANNNFRTLRVMMGEAHRLGNIPVNPCAGIELLGTDPKPRDILRLDEIDRLFSAFTVEKVWPDPSAYVGTMLAACTGLRSGELRALRTDQVHSDHIVIDASLDAMHGDRKKTKNRKTRLAPIPSKLYQHLSELIGDRTGYVFTEDGTNPVHSGYFREHFYASLEAIGIDEKIRTDRSLIFHGLRIYANTMFLINGIPETTTRSIIGHLSEEMTEHYSRVPAEVFKLETKATSPVGVMERTLEAA